MLVIGTPSPASPVDLRFQTAASSCRTTSTSEPAICPSPGKPSPVSATTRRGPTSLWATDIWTSRITRARTYRILRWAASSSAQASVFDRSGPAAARRLAGTTPAAGRVDIVNNAHSRNSRRSHINRAWKTAAILFDCHMKIHQHGRKPGAAAAVTPARGRGGALHAVDKAVGSLRRAGAYERRDRPERRLFRYCAPCRRAKIFRRRPGAKGYQSIGRPQRDPRPDRRQWCGKIDPHQDDHRRLQADLRPHLYP